MMNRFDDVYDTTEQRQPTYSWAQSVDIINDVLYREMKAQSLAGFEAKREQIAEAWSTILRGV